jgi:hypothetical protein
MERTPGRQLLTGDFWCGIIGPFARQALCLGGVCRTCFCLIPATPHVALLQIANCFGCHAKTFQTLRLRVTLSTLQSARQRTHLRNPYSIAAISRSTSLHFLKNTLCLKLFSLRTLLSSARKHQHACTNFASKQLSKHQIGQTKAQHIIGCKSNEHVPQH